MNLDARCIPYFSTQLKDDDAIRPLAAAAGFSAEVGTCLLTAGDTPTMLVGCGDPEKLTGESLRLAFGEGGRSLAHLGGVEVDITSIGDEQLEEAERDKAVAEGLTLGSYRFDRHQAQRLPRTRWTPISASEAWNEGLAVATAVNSVRDLVNEPANVVNPMTLAEHFVQLGATHGLTVNVRDEEWLEREGAGGILAIGRGSEQRPKMVEIVHVGEGQEVDLCLIGKGVTFDSGGLSMKAPSAMMLMQSDMAAAATIAYAMSFLAAVAPSLNVRAYCPLVENMPGPYSTRPGDIVTARNGKTIEVLDTDYEGRVVLADALAFASEHRPRHILDMATLTYGAPNALGPRMAALFGTGNAPSLVALAAKSSGEPVWELPMLDYLMPTVRSRVADVKNFPYEPKARASTAAMFLREFVPADASWAHVDIAGPSWTDEAYGVNPTGATGFGLRLLLDLFVLISDAKEGTRD